MNLQEAHELGWEFKIVNVSRPQMQPPFWRFEATPPMEVYDRVDDISLKVEQWTDGMVQMQGILASLY